MVGGLAQLLLAAPLLVAAEVDEMEAAAEAQATAQLRVQIGAEHQLCHEIPGTGLRAFTNRFAGRDATGGHLIRFP